MLEITRELLSHYMRVQGWKEDGRGDMSVRKHRWSTLWWDREASVADGLTLEANRSGEAIATVAFRLGLCAAAEKPYDDAASVTRGSLESANEAGVIGLAAHRLILLAGIQIRDWESARKR